MPYNPGYKTVHKVEELPKDFHYAVLADTSVTYEDGYGGNSTANYMDYMTFKDAAELQTWVEATEARNSSGGYGSKTTYKVIQVKPVEVKKTVTIAIGHE